MHIVFLLAVFGLLSSVGNVLAIPVPTTERIGAEIHEAGTTGGAVHQDVPPAPRRSSYVLREQRPMPTIPLPPIPPPHADPGKAQKAIPVPTTERIGAEIHEAGTTGGEVHQDVPPAPRRSSYVLREQRPMPTIPLPPIPPPHADPGKAQQAIPVPTTERIGAETHGAGTTGGEVHQDVPPAARRSSSVKPKQRPMPTIPLPPIPPPHAHPGKAQQAIPVSTTERIGAAELEKYGTGHLHLSPFDPKKPLSSGPFKPRPEPKIPLPPVPPGPPGPVHPYADPSNIPKTPAQTAQSEPASQKPLPPLPKPASQKPLPLPPPPPPNHKPDLSNVKSEWMDSSPSRTRRAITTVGSTMTAAGSRVKTKLTTTSSGVRAAMKKVYPTNWRQGSSTAQP